MSFPFVISDNFESGATALTASSGSLIDVPHYTTLARYGMAPYRGAYCGRIRLAGGTTSQFWREDTAFDDWTTGVTRCVRFYFYLGKDLVMAASDKFSLFEAESTLNTTTEIAAGIQNNGGTIQVWFNTTQAAGSASTISLGSTTTALGKWYCLEVKGLVVTGGATGTIDCYVDDVAGTQKASIQAGGAIVDAKIGVIGPDAGTSGTVLIDQIVYDDTQIYRDKGQYRDGNAWVYQAQDHPIIGPGEFSAAVTGTGVDAVMTLYDTDGIPTNLTPLAVLRNVSANEFVPGHDIFTVNHGLYCTLAGTSPQAFFSITRAHCLSDATVIARGLKNGHVKPY